MRTRTGTCRACIIQGGGEQFLRRIRLKQEERWNTGGLDKDRVANVATPHELLAVNSRSHYRLVFYSVHSPTVGEEHSESLSIPLELLTFNPTAKEQKKNRQECIVYSRMLTGESYLAILKIGVCKEPKLEQQKRSVRREPLSDRQQMGFELINEHLITLLT